MFYFQSFVAILMLYRVIFARTKIHETRNTNNSTFLDDVPLPFESYIPFEHSQGFSYYAASAFQLFGTWLFGFYISLIDATICAFMIHSNAQLLILKNYINLFLEKSEERFVCGRE